MSTVRVDPTKLIVVMQEALQISQIFQRGLEVLRDCVDPIFRLRVRFYLLLVLVEFQSYVELEALNH